jgi:hypothetical protein
MFTNILRDETQRLNMRAVEVDASLTEDDLAQRVAGILGL